MTLTKAVKFYRNYEGLMTDEEIQEETGYSAERIRRQIVKSDGQLCWKCANACNDDKCEWVASLHGDEEDLKSVKYPDYVKTTTITRFNKIWNKDETYITRCKRYAWDGKS